MALSLTTENELHGWVVQNCREAQGLIADLIYQLIDLSVKDKTTFRIPRSDSIGQHGRDLILETEDGYAPYVPEGKSVWEMGVSGDPRDKANEDYRARTNNTSQEERSRTTFVFVTPRSAHFSWSETQQADWIAKKKAKNEWWDVKIIDATLLVQWIGEFPSVDVWLAEKLGKPVKNLERADSFWSDLSTIGSPPPLHPEVFTSNRETACIKLKELLGNLTNQLQIDTHIRSQAMDFVAAYIATLPHDEHEKVVGNCLFVSTRDAWKYLSGLPRKLILVANFDLEEEDTEATRLLQRARNNNHAVIYVRPPGGVPSAFSVPIPDPTAYQLQYSLEKSDYPSERARTIAQYCNGRLSVLLKLIQPFAARPEWTQGTEASELVIAELLGSWHESSEADRKVAETLSGKEYGEWIKVIRYMANRPATPLSHRDGIWKFNNRYEGWYELGSHIFDDHLDRFKSLAIQVLTEQDPIFDVESKNRNVARLQNVRLKHSTRIRTGIAETLALLGSHSKALTSCTLNKAEFVSVLVVREVLGNRNWSLWATLDSELPLLAEAAPSQFLDAIESLIAGHSSLIVEIFKQEGGPIFGQNYMSGLLWALETLAWSPEYITRVIVVLGGLAALDPGGKWANRPANSIRAILLPWLPQTCASIEGRYAAVKILLREHPTEGWKSLLELLPEGHSSSSHTRRPAWREFIPNTWQEQVTNKSYLNQVEIYANLAVDVASKDLSKVNDLIDRLGDLSPTARVKFFGLLESKDFISASESIKSAAWNKISDFVAKHRQFSDAEWAVPDDLLLQLSSILNLIAPTSIEKRSGRLFADNDFELLEERETYEKTLAKVEEIRRDAIRKIFEQGKEDAVINFSKVVIAHWKVGLSFGSLTFDTDHRILPSCLASEEKPLRLFAGGYVLSRFRCRGWSWVDGLNQAEWNAEQKGYFFSYLPFIEENWKRVERSLGDECFIYWSKASANPYEEKSHLSIGIENLIKYDRPASAIQCLSGMLYLGQEIIPDLAISALEKLKEGKEATNSADSQAITKVISALQGNPSTDQAKLIRIEWSYLSLLNGHFGPEPKTLGSRIADDPQLFLDLIQSIYRSSNSEEKREASQEQGDKAAQAFDLLRKWKTIPGSREGGVFDQTKMHEWISEVRSKSRESGHLEVALTQIGHVLAHSPPDSSGLCILEPVATVLNELNADAMRNGFRIEILNSRGVHWGSNGSEERELAAKYFKNADALDNAGYQRLAATVREIGNSYVRYAESEEREKRLEE